MSKTSVASTALSESVRTILAVRVLRQPLAPVDKDREALAPTRFARAVRCFDEGVHTPI
jgi:hypothetical protein